jgi:hypothetical protein
MEIQWKKNIKDIDYEGSDPIKHGLSMFLDHKGSDPIKHGLSMFLDYEGSDPIKHGLSMFFDHKGSDSIKPGLFVRKRLNCHFIMIIHATYNFNSIAGTLEQCFI